MTSVILDDTQGVTDTEGKGALARYRAKGKDVQRKALQTEERGTGRNIIRKVSSVCRGFVVRNGVK